VNLIVVGAVGGAARYGYEDKPIDRLAERLDLARAKGDWAEVAKLAAELRTLSESNGHLKLSEAGH